MDALKLRMILLYVIGAGVGGFAGALAGSYIVDKWVNKEEPYSRPTINDGPEPVDELEETGQILEEKQEKKEPKKQMRTKTAPTEYTRYFKSEKAKLTLEELEAEASKYRGRPALIDGKVPCVITAEEFQESEKDKLTYTYYSEDNTLLDESEEVVQSDEDLFPKDWINKFGWESNDRDAVYLYNPKYQTNYEVLRIHKAYKIAVLGESSDIPVAQQPRKKRVRPVARPTKKEDLCDGEEPNDEETE